ncbi:MAG: cupin domain-containing protein [Pseudomonadota bacterium]
MTIPQRNKAKPRVGAQRVAPRRAANRFSVVRMREADFKGEGLRSFYVYRDLGIRRATGGRVDAHVVRPLGPSQGGTGRHRHTLDFQMVYCLRGWMTFWYKGHGNVKLKAGDCVCMPANIHHDLFDWSPDMEFLEVLMPAKYGTVEV